MNDFEKKLTSYVEAFNTYASQSLDVDKFYGRESKGLDRMLEAMSYSLENGGKRVRPVLALEFCRVCGGKAGDVLPLALAIEMVHTYSLIHDDLPCMDNDDMRRGKPSNHIAFGYADALLAGDALLTLAFEKIADCALDDERKIKAILCLSKAAGCSGMIAGQVMDLQNEEEKANLETVRKTDELKTGEMIKAAAVMGCIAADADREKTKAAVTYAKKIGLVFQIIDDILDVTGSEDELGKPIGSDDENAKSTYVSLMGLDDAYTLAENETNEAIASLNIFGDEAAFLKDFALSLIHRKK